jgi:DNA-binding NarL/FixJ family response regulator
MAIKVFLADDHKIFRQGLHELIAEQQDMTIVGEAEDGRDALAQIVKLRPDVVVMDIGMPALNGIETTRRIKQDIPKTHVIALSMHPDEKYVVEMLRAGATGYLCKTCEADELVKAIRTVASGQTHLNPAITGHLVDNYVRNITPAPVSAFSRLTEREREILQLLAEEKSIKEIASELHLSIKTIHSHRENVMQKLDVQTMAGLIKYALREGLVDL